MSESQSVRPSFDAKQAIDTEKNQTGYCKTLTWQERMIVANYLNSIKYNYPKNNPPKMDRTAFRAGNQAEINAEEDAKVK